VSPRAIAHVAGAVFRESVRDRVLYNLVGFALLLMGASVLVGQLSAGQDVKVVKDLGLASMSLFGLFIAVFIGIGLVWKEVDRKTIYSLLAKPVGRVDVIAGKYAGLVLTVLVNLCVMAAVLYLVLAVVVWRQPAAAARAWEAPALDPRLLVAVFLIFLELSLVVAIALFFSTFASPLLSATFTVGLFVAGHFTVDLQQLDAVVASPALGVLGGGLYHLLPDFAVFDVNAAVVHGVAVPGARVALTAAYAVLYTISLLMLSILVFARRDFR